MKFPSPLGELYFLMLTTAQLEQVDLLTVSVPSRGAIFLNIEKMLQEFDSGNVSVPSRGAIFLNKIVKRLEEKLMVSVPSRGAIFLNVTKNVLKLLSEFPSPLGELYFLMINSSVLQSNVTSFPSPLGELYFLIWKISNQ